MGRIDPAELDLASYEYDVPPELIAQEPVPERGRSRLFVLDRASRTFTHRSFPDILAYLDPGDCLVLNRTRVVPARIFGTKETGGRVEVLFLDPCAGGPAHREDGGHRQYRVLLKPFLKEGSPVLLPGGLAARVEAKTPDGETILHCSGAELTTVLERHGVMPLPPYIKRPKGEDRARAEADRRRYQTVYASEKGSIAAPTAGLHFTDELLVRAKEKGVTVAQIVLHVGWGTFRPIVARTAPEHRMLPERYEIDAAAAKAINDCRARKGKVVAVGTTTVRSLESAAAVRPGPLAAARGETALFIYPGYRFSVVDRMLTNFHLPHSTPLMMVSAFAGRPLILEAYRAAVAEKYRFFSYGDAMLIR